VNVHNKFFKRKTPALLVLGLLTIAPLFLAAENGNEFALRRDQVKAALKGRSIVHSGLPVVSFDKNFYYLTGIREPDALLLIAPKGWNDTLFLKTIPDEAKLRSMIETSGISRILSFDLFNLTFGAMLSWPWDLYIPKIYNYSYYFLLDAVKTFPFLKIRDLWTFLARMRMIKSPGEIDLLGRAAEITAAGLSAAMRAAAPGIFESELQSIIESVFLALGAERTSFDSIIGSGPNSVIIHYSDNSRKTEAGDLVVMDVGAEFGEYAGDITRTIPVSGTFTPRQKDIYDIVLEAQSRAIAACRVGATTAEVDLAARNFIDGKGYGAYFTHFTCHSLGLDVHDSWNANGRLLPGVVLTIEPGIYIPAENLGVRIEDDVLITPNGPIVLSSFVPKKADEIEHLMAGSPLPARKFPKN